MWYLTKVIGRIYITHSSHNCNKQRVSVLCRPGGIIHPENTYLLLWDTPCFNTPTLEQSARGIVPAIVYIIVFIDVIIVHAKVVAAL